MEYVIGTVQRRSGLWTILKTKGEEHTDFSGRITLEQTLGNTTIRDVFTVVKKYQTADASDGTAYDWYYISDHYHFEDKSEEVRVKMEQQITDLEIETIEQDIALTDHDIAIMELQDQIEQLSM